MIKKQRLLWLPGILVLLIIQLHNEGSTQNLYYDNEVKKSDAVSSPNNRVQPPPIQPRATTVTTHSHQQKSEDTSSSQPQRQQRRLCRNEQEVTQGLWHPLTLPRPPYMPMSPRVRCLPSSAFSQPFATFEWIPTDCTLHRWNATTLLHLIHDETILFVGDSLTLEHYASLVHLLGDRARLPPKAVKHGRIQRHICDSNNCVDVVFFTDFFLHNVTDAIRSISTATTQFPRVLVLNRGAHYQPDDELMKSLQTNTFPALQQWNEQCRQHDYNNQRQMPCLLIWRTTVPGHPHCQNFTKPATSVSEMETWITEQSTKDATVYRKGEFHWHDFQRQNQLVTRQLLQWQRALPHVNIRIMDSYRTNILRPDHHRSHMNDCLHSCSPGGGSDLNSQWLLHILVVERQKREQQGVS